MGKQTITFSLLLNNYNPIFNLRKLCGTCSGIAQCIAEKRGIDLSFFVKKQKTRARKAYEFVFRKTENSFTF